MAEDGEGLLIGADGLATDGFCWGLHGRQLRPVRGGDVSEVQVALADLVFAHEQRVDLEDALAQLRDGDAPGGERVERRLEDV